MITLFVKNTVLRDSLKRLLERLGNKGEIRLIEAFEDSDMSKTHLIITDQLDLNSSDITVMNVSEEELPIRPSVFLMRVQRALEKNAGSRGLKEIHLGSYIFRPHNFLLQTPDKNEIVLTEKERDILLYIYRQMPNPVMRDALLHAVWGYGDNIETHTLETHIYRLRQKIETDPSSPQFLQTTDEGYILNMV